MKKRISYVLLAVLAVIVVILLLRSCNGCSGKAASAPAAEVQSTAAAPIVEETAPAAQPAENVAEEAAAEPAAEVVVEPEAEEESAPAEEESAPIAAAPAPVAAAEKVAEPAPAEEPVVEKAPAQEAAPAAEPEPAPTTAEPIAETAAESVAVAAVAEEASEPDKKTCGSHILTVGISPWGWQHFHTDESGLDDKNSTYGLGGKIAYTYLFNNGFYVGAEYAYETYFLDHRDNFHDIMFFVDGGYNFALTEKFGLYAGLGGGIELENYEGESSWVGLAKANLGLGYALTEHFILGAGCDFILSFSDKDSVNYMGFQIIPCITASYKF
jgi:flavodoxin